MNRGASGPFPTVAAARCGPGVDIIRDAEDSWASRTIWWVKPHCCRTRPSPCPGCRPRPVTGTVGSACPTRAACAGFKVDAPRSSCVCSSSWPASRVRRHHASRTLSPARDVAAAPPEPAKEPPNECDRYGGTNANADPTRQARSAATLGYSLKPARSRLRPRRSPPAGTRRCGCSPGWSAEFGAFHGDCRARAARHPRCSAQHVGRISCSTCSCTPCWGSNQEPSRSSPSGSPAPWPGNPNRASCDCRSARMRRRNPWTRPRIVVRRAVAPDRRPSEPRTPTVLIRPR